MGSEVVELYVGGEGQEVLYTVHKGLLGQSGGAFHNIASGRLAPTQRVVLNEHPAVFKLFVEVLYSRRVPEVLTSAVTFDNSERLRNLCRLYAMVDRYQVKQGLRNMVMDKVQDGFLRLDRLPEPPLVKAIYSHTTAGSQLRKFCAASLVFSLRSLDYVDNGSLKKLIMTDEEVMEDFLEAVRKFSDNQDPRARHCHGDFGGCLACTKGSGHGSVNGICPCYFHNHNQHQVKVGNNDEPEPERDPFSDHGCYLWPTHAGGSK